jgi:hypothetical protein
MLKVIFTLDYEIHGNGDGDPKALMIEPTRRMMDLFERYGAKLTIMADVAEILKFREYNELRGRDDYHYQAIADQLCEAIRRGHDVQLHLHASYFNAEFKDGRWQQDWSEYNFAALPFHRLNEIVRTGKEYLENLLKPVDPAYACTVFRAANWAVSPSGNVVRALLNNGIHIDTSVFKYGRREGIVNFDYSHAPSELVPWRVDEEDICRRNDAGKLVEIPIYCEPRWIGAFLTPNRIRRALMNHAHPMDGGHLETGGADPKSPSQQRVLLAKLCLLTKRHAWKADFNQCTGRQLSEALNRASRNHDCGVSQLLPFVLIGHSKLFGRTNESSLSPFLEHVAQNPGRFRFGVFGGIGTAPHFRHEAAADLHRCSAGTERLEPG